MKMALLSRKVFVVMINFQLSLAIFNLRQTAPLYSDPMCPGDTVVFICYTNGFRTLTWSLDSHTNVTVTNGTTDKLMSFTITQSFKNGIFSSNATMTYVTRGLNGTDIFCSSMNFTNMATLTVRNITSLGPPIGLSVTALNEDLVNLTWSPPSLDSVCVTKYVINTITDTQSLSDIYTTNSSKMIQVNSGEIYQFIVAAIDKTNTTGGYSEHFVIKLSDTTLNGIYKIFTSDSIITVYWNLPPIDDHYPHIINITDFFNLTITSNITNYNIECDIATGSIYFINILTEKGPNTTIYVSLNTPNATSICDYIIHYNHYTSLSLSISPNVVSSSYSHMTSSIIPTTPTVTVTIISAIGGTILVIIIILVIFISIIVCFAMKNKKSKKSSSLNLYTSQADSMMKTGNTSNPQPIVQEQTVPIYAEINKKQNPSVQEYSDNGPPSNESTGQYFLLNNDVETPPIPPISPISPPANTTEAPLHSYEYSLINKLYDKKQSREQGSTLEQTVYAEVGDIKCNRPTIPDPPVSFPMEAVMYSEVMKPSKQLPGRDNVMLELEDITSPPPPIPPKTRL